LSFTLGVLENQNTDAGREDGSGSAKTYAGD
jgi:hypothetical protein